MADAPGFEAAATAEAHYRRMLKLREMSASELRAALSTEPDKSAPWIESAARYGVARAQLRLGQMRLDGIGGPRDEDAALRWFTRAAKAGEAQAMNMVGRCFENGWGAAETPDEAARWYAQAAEAGDDWGQYNYANMLFDGRGVPQDRAQAVRLYECASAQGHARAMNLLARCYEEGWGVARDPGRAYDWYRRSADGGYFRAQYNVATLLLAQDRLEEALERFDSACREATESSRATMIEALVRHDNPAVSALGRQLAQAFAESAA